MDSPYSITIPQDKVGVSPSCGSMIPLADGRALWVWGTAHAETPLQANHSEDGGRTWSDPDPLRHADGSGLIGLYAPALIRLQSGRLGLVQRQGVAREEAGTVRSAVTFHTSADEGQTWSDGVPIDPGPGRYDVYFDQIVQLQSGRLVVPFTQDLGPTPGPGSIKLTRRWGRSVSYEPTYRIRFALTCLSDDEGGTWRRSRNEVHAALERGRRGTFAVSEPCIAELSGGTLVMLLRTGLGRSFRTESTDGGETWTESEPTGMSPRTGPMGMKRIPGTDDLLVLWNMISASEALEGLYRHRLVTSISSDGGRTFHHHRILESLDDRCDLEPEPVEPVLSGFFDVRLSDTQLWAATEGGTGARQPVDRVRYHRAPGPLRVDHPSCTFRGEEVIIHYSVGVLGDPNVITRTYGMDFLQVCERLGFRINRPKVGSVLGNSRVKVARVGWVYGEE